MMNLFLPKWAKSVHSTNNIIDNIEDGVRTTRQMQETFNYMCFTSTILAKNVKEALKDVY